MLLIQTLQNTELYDHPIEVFQVIETHAVKRPGKHQAQHTRTEKHPGQTGNRPAKIGNGLCARFKNVNRKKANQLRYSYSGGGLCCLQRGRYYSIIVNDSGTMGYLLHIDYKVQ